MNEDINERLKQINIEDTIWIIYFFLIMLSLIANNLERKYFIYNDIQSKEKYRKLIIIVFSIATILYLYFFYDSIKAYKNLNQFDSEQKKKLTEYSLIGSTLILIAGIIFLYVSYKDEDIEVEVSFN